MAWSPHWRVGLGAIILQWPVSLHAAVVHIHHRHHIHLRSHAASKRTFPLTAQAYSSGHDHHLEHLQMPGHAQPDYVISGAGSQVHTIARLAYPQRLVDKSHSDTDQFPESSCDDFSLFKIP